MARVWWLGFALLVACAAEDPHNAPPEACTPSCAGRVCGTDGCGGNCGECALLESCSLDGQCFLDCHPDCSDRICGSDGCGGTCGACSGATPACTILGRCVDCIPDCDGRVCGSDGCGGTCGTCTSTALTCTATSGQCR